MLLMGFGFTLARISGSHQIYEYAEGDIWRQVIVPLHGRKVKKLYVKKAVEVVDELFPDEETEGTDGE